jgi:hypothetical protein
VTFGIAGIVGRLGSGGSGGLGSDGWVAGKVSNVGCGSVGIEGNGGSVGLGKFGREGKLGTCRRWRAASPSENDRVIRSLVSCCHEEPNMS